jgi:hypothetical protein
MAIINTKATVHAVRFNIAGDVYRAMGGTSRFREYVETLHMPRGSVVDRLTFIKDSDQVQLTVRHYQLPEVNMDAIPLCHPRVARNGDNAWVWDWGLDNA